MQIKKDTLLSMLNISKIAVAGSEHVEQLTHFIFSGDEIITFNNRMAVFYPFKTDFQCSVRHDLFYKQLTKFTSNEINITLSGSKIVMQGLNEKAMLSVILDKDDEIFKILHSIQNDHVDSLRIPVPENFNKAMSFSAFSASKDASDGVLGCVCVNGDKVYSTDNHRASEYKLHGNIGERFLVDHAVAVELDKFHVFEISLGENWLSFYCDEDIIITSRQFYGDYPDFAQAFDIDDYESLHLPDSLKDAIDFVSVILSKVHPLDRVCQVNIENKEIKVSADRTTESSEKSVALQDSDGEVQLEFTINAEFLKTIINHTHTMDYSTELSRAMFTSKDFKHVIRMK